MSCAPGEESKGSLKTTLTVGWSYLATFMTGSIFTTHGWDQAEPWHQGSAAV